MFGAFAAVFIYKEIITQENYFLTNSTDISDNNLMCSALKAKYISDQPHLIDSITL